MAALVLAAEGGYQETHLGVSATAAVLAFIPLFAAIAVLLIVWRGRRVRPRSDSEGQ